MELLHYYCLFAYILPQVFASPAANTTEVEPPWVPEPDGRGTISILLSCGVTLSLCVWSAVHVDVAAEPSMWMNLFEKIQWMLVALFAPERTILLALSQWRKAREIHRSCCETFSITAGSKEDTIGMAGAFFAVMGGFSVGPSDCFSRYPFTLTTKGFLHLLEAGVIPKRVLNKRYIEDKAKADIFIKSLACLQVSWMILQCIARKANGLPVTLLELHVIIQVVCVAAMYGLWWYKPLDVNEPIPVIEDRELGSLLAIVSSRRKDICLEVMPHLEPGPFIAPPVASFEITKHQLGADNSNLTDRITRTIFLRKHPSPHDSSNLIQFPIDKVTFGQRSPNIIREPPGSIGDGKLEEGSGKCNNSIVVTPGESLAAVNEFAIQYCGSRKEGTCTLNGTDIENFRLASNAIRSGKYKEYTALRLDEPYQKLVAKPSTNFPRVDTGIGALLHIIYAACHATAWNAYFPSPAERWLWRISCVVIASLSPSTFIYRRASRLLGFEDKALFLERSGPAQFGTSFLYIASKGFLILEALISIRSLPVGSYKTVQWEKYWPHGG